MKTILIILLALCPLACVWGQGDATCERELQAAQKWMVSKGVADPQLEQGFTNDYLVVFNSKRRRGFCVVARADVWEKLGQPVLGYSLNHYMNWPKDETYGVLLNIYENQIKSLRQPFSLPVISQAQRDTVAPLLGTISWGQHAPYNAYSPHLGQSRILIGCVPLAMALVMRYHEWPQQGESDVYIHPRGLDVLRYDFSKLQPQWADYVDRYGTADSTATLVSLSRTLGTLSLCTDPGISEGAVSKNVGEIKHLFVNNLRYSGRVACKFLKDVPAWRVDSLMRSEIKAHRPCIVSRGRHAFVCDGVEGDFFHFNLGWHGNHNGYFRLLINGRKETTGLLNALVYGLEPQREEVAREVVLTKANTLSEALPKEELQRVTSLTIVGPVGGDDVRLLRQMAGAVEGDAMPCYPWGALQRLDLSRAKLVKGKAAYTTRLATGTRWKTWTRSDGVHTYTEKKTFDFSKMDDKAWREFKAVIGTDVDGWRYTRTSDGRCWVHHYLTANQTVGKYMFADCTSLREVVLPEELKSIDDYAFQRCQSLQTLKVPKKTKELGRLPFNYCLSLSELWLPKGIALNGKVAELCSHNFKVFNYEK